MKQLLFANLNQQGEIAMCLEFAHEAFGIPNGYPTAWQAWLHSIQHTDPIPTDVEVPVWFSYINPDTGENQGHVVISMPGKGFLSSPWKKGTTQALLQSIAEVERIYHCTYVGWSEDINNVKVVTGEDTMTEDGVRFGYLAVTMQQPTADQLTYWVGRSSQEFTQALYKLADGYIVAKTKQVTDLNQKLSGEALALEDMQKERDTLKDENDILNAKLAELNITVNTPATDAVVIKKDSVWSAFVGLINKLFKKG